MIYYTGVGARDVPPEVARTMTLYGAVFAELGYTLRSGGATGSDTAFEIGCDNRQGKKEIYLPWKGYNDNPSELWGIPDTDAGRAAVALAADLYGQERWSRVSHGVRKLMTRNIFQVMSQNLDTLSDFVVCWTPDGVRTAEERTRKTGGTGQAIACASQYDIPVFNLRNEGEVDRLLDFVGKLPDDT